MSAYGPFCEKPQALAYHCSPSTGWFSGILTRAGILWGALAQPERTVAPAAVKAESDVCCTSGNAVHVVESLGVDEVIFIPDEYLARNVAAQTKVRIISWPGHCEVHERFTPADIATLRAGHPGIVVLAHPECDRPVVEAADFAGSTHAMSKYVAERKPRQVALITECSMSDNVAIANPDVEFVRPCNLCPHMKRITLGRIRRALETMTFEVSIDPAVAERARAAVERMLAIGAPPPVPQP